jgi:hypothetical protein
LLLENAMKPVKLNAIAFQDVDGAWIAQCIQYDIVARAESLVQLPKVLEREVAANFCINAKLGRPDLSGIPPAPEHFRKAFEAAEYRMRPQHTDEAQAVQIDELGVIEAEAA